MTPAIQSTLGLSSISAPVTLALLLAAGVYLRGWLRLRSSTLSGRRLSAFMSGMFALWIVFASPLRDLHHELLLVHMVDHIFLMAVAPPLILLGAPRLSFLKVPLLRFLPQSLRGLVSRSPEHSLGSVLGNPISCWLAATIALLGWHVPAAFELGMRSNPWHEVEYACFFGTGLLFWWPVIQSWRNAVRSPRWSIVLYLFFATLPCDILSAFLTFCDRVVYPCYLSGNQHCRISPLRDQEYAGALMWVCVTFVYLVPAVAITMQLLSAPSSHDPNAGQNNLPQVSSRPLVEPGVEAL